MNLRKHILRAALALPLAAAAQTITFDEADYKAVGVYDSWEASPFRTGALEGNAAVVDNHLDQVDASLDFAPNTTARILGLQRSRHGSNLLGVRIDLNETFELTTTTRYVHVLIHKPIEGRAMLIGLGKRTDRSGQSAETEQFWALSTATLTPGAWSDAVFPIKGAGGIDIHSLVVVPDCESPHRLTEDFVAYVDQIEVTADATPRFRHGDYVVSFEDDATTTRSDRKVTGIALAGSADGEQSMTWGTLSPTPAYHRLLGQSFTAKAGETLTPTFAYSGTWMNGYVYLDRGSDGKFEAKLADDYTIPAGSDIMTYAYVETVANTEGYLSDGTKVSGSARNVLNPPAFTLPDDLPVGYYRMRFKVDWGSIDPAGASTLISNGGMIVDTRLNIHADVCHVTSANRNGAVLAADGTALSGYEAPFGQPFTVLMDPEEGFTYEGIRVRYGYNLSADSLVHGTPQYVDVTYPAYLFREDKFTIPADVMTADVLIEGLFVEKTADTTEPADDYPLNFARELTISRTDRHLNAFTISGTQGGTTTITLASGGTNYVYRDMTDREVSLVPGDVVTTTIDYTGRAMHGYLYIDLSQDGQFMPSLNADGSPSLSGELVSYSYYAGQNSLGQTVEGAAGNVSVASIPSFTLPSYIPTGVYRARFKMDWNNIDPAGQWSQDGTNKINDNGGYVVDVLLNVHNPSHPLEVSTENGSLHGASNTGLPLQATCFEALAVVPTPAADGYEAELMTIQHGHNFSGPQYVHGNRQWSQYTVPAQAYTLPADSVNGDVRISVSFQPTADAEYELVFSDEFDAADGTQPAADVWQRCPRQSSTWNRWLSDSEAVVYQQGGQLVARAIPNPDTATDNVPMITGGVQTRGSYDFRYGKIEARILTNPHRGNFPAFWLMPTDQSDGWPACGEIDIWEQIDAQNTAYHTVHSHWTYDLGNRTNPTSSFSESVQMDRYHTYGLEWTEDQLTWFVDGRQVGQYARLADNATALEQGQWPFDKAFYIILNQSVGNGSWAAAADESHTYETRFDWVRVYQKTGDPSAVDPSARLASLGVHGGQGFLLLSADVATPATVCDLAGRVVWAGSVVGQQRVPLQRGVYVVAARKVLVR